MPVALLLVAILLEAKPLWSGEPGWQREWTQILAAAKREGKVVLSGWPDVSLRRELPRAFSEKFGIPLEYVPGRGEIPQRLRRGTYRISFDADSAEVKRLRLEGFPLSVVYRLPDKDPKHILRDPAQNEVVSIRVAEGPGPI